MKNFMFVLSMYLLGFSALTQEAPFIEGSGAKEFYRRFKTSEDRSAKNLLTKQENGILLCIEGRFIKNIPVYSCSFNGKMLRIAGAAAREAYENLRSETVMKTTYSFKGDEGTLSCMVHAAPQGSVSYQCSFAGLTPSKK